MSTAAKPRTPRAAALPPSDPNLTRSAARDDAWSALELTEVLDRVREEWEKSGDFTIQTLDRAGETMARFAGRQKALGCPLLGEVNAEGCRMFVDSHTVAGGAPELTTRHARRTALRMLFRTLRELGHDVGDPTLDLALPTRTVTAARPLTDLEVTQCRTAARLGEAGSFSLLRAAAWALGETTAVSSEISAIRLGDLDNPDHPRWVRLPGTRRHDPRLGELTDWGSTILARQAALLTSRHATPDRHLAYSGSAEGGQAKAQAAMCNAIGAVLKYTGLATEADIRPASLRNWAGRRLFDGGMPIDQVARRMGARSLDAAAADLGLDWRS
jgi:integrase/recombinase XerC